jgi:hypothetical protein
MKIFSMFMLITLLSLPIFCQTVKGRVQEHNGKALPYVNVLLLNSKDSSLVKVGVTDTSGVYEIDNIPHGTYLLSASMMGYKRSYLFPINVTLQNPFMEAETFRLIEDITELTEIVIAEKRPFVEQYIDRMVVNVANSIIAGGSTALEVLEKAPGVTVDRQNNALMLRGKSGVIIQLDGKQTYLSMEDMVTLLSTMPSDNIEQIELITNPSAKYDAAGNSGIINIRLKKNNDIGTNGSLSLGLGTGRYPRSRGSVQGNHRTRRINVFGNYSANRGGNYFDLKSNQEIISSNQRNLTDQDTYIEFRDRGQNAKAGLDYFVGKNTTIGVVWTGFWNNNGEEGTAVSSFQHDEKVPYYLQASTDKTISSISSNQIGNVNVQHTFGEKGGQLAADFDLAYYRRDFSNTLLTQTSSIEQPVQPLASLINQMPTEIDIRTIKMDYRRKLSAKWNMEVGIKSSYVFSDNDLTVSSGEVGNIVVDPELSNHFQYTEKVNAAYATLAGKPGTKTDIMAGLRAEHTRSLGESIIINEEVSRNYINLFPSLFVFQVLSANQSITFSYSYRIDRPNYQYLNPGRSYVDPYLYTRGNAYLKPQYTHSLELKHGFKDKLFTSLGASYVNDLVFYVIQPVDSIRTERTPLNIGTSQSYNLNISFPIEIMKGWNMQTNFLSVYSKFDYSYQDVPITVEQISGRFNASNTFVFGKNWTGELTGWLNTPAVFALSRSPWLGSVDVGIQKAFAASWKVKLNVQDIFHSNKFIGTIDVPNFTSSYTLAFDTRIVMVSMIYAFGNQQLRSARQRRLGSEDEMQRTN